MRNKLIAAMLLAVATLAAAAQSYAPAGDRLRTAWGENIDTTDGGWKDYPRPLLQRDTWQNLNGMWRYAIVPKQAAQPTEWDGRILVPYCVESALSGVGRRLSADSALWYTRTFAVPEAWTARGGRVMLNFGAVDWQATVWVNGKPVGQHTGGYTPFALDITPALKRGSNTLTVQVLDGTDAGYQPCGKQRSKSRGIWYTPVSGIWQTVWIEPVSKAHISGLYAQPDVAGGRLKVVAQSNAQGAQVTVKVLDGGNVVATGSGKAGDTVAVAMPQGFKLWTPDEPNLYDLQVTLSLGGKEQETVKSYTAMRQWGKRKDADGHWRLTLNGDVIFEFGTLDQGWWPDGLYTAPGDEALRFDIDKTKQWGFNMIRKHVKVEPALWYAHCDRAGIIVWQDMPSGDYQADQPWQRTGYYRGPASKRSPESVANYYKEWGEIIDALRSYPCISTWVPFNEAWGQFDTDKVAQWTRERDPQRLVNAASGGNYTHGGDMLDIHNYPEPKMTMSDPERVNVLGEYGGLGLPIEGFTWVKSDKNWGYVKFKNAQELTAEYIKLAQQLIELAHKGFSAAIYTQTTDCETEVNGIMTYDRTVVKMDESDLRDINQQVVRCLKK